MTTVNEAFPSKYLKAGDLNNRTIRLKINNVIFEEIGQNKDKKPVVYFADAKKGMVLNKTNAKRIEKMHGAQMDGWTGKEIELYSELVSFQGEEVPSIRVRVVAPEPDAPIPARPKRDDFDDPIDI